MEEFVYYNNLYDLYGELLTEKQRAYFEDYYFHNLSFTEMAENYEVSRNAVFKQLHITIDKLIEYENKLGLLAKKAKLLDLVKNIPDSKLKKELSEII